MEKKLEIKRSKNSKMFLVQTLFCCSNFLSTVHVLSEVHNEYIHCGRSRLVDRRMLRIQIKSMIGLSMTKITIAVVKPSQFLGYVSGARPISSLPRARKQSSQARLRGIDFEKNEMDDIDGKSVIL